MNFPKISIVVPSFNQGQYLEATLVSIISQQYPELELLVSDGGSTDGSVDIIEKYKNHITWWVSERDKGQSDAINKGLKIASGEIITWLCSDDLFTPGTLIKVAEYFSKQSPEVGLIHGGTTLFRDHRKISNNWGYSNPSLERNLGGMAFPQPSAFILKKYFDKIGRHVNENLHYGMDYELYARLACVCRFVHVKDIFSEYRLHDNSKSVKEQDKFIGDWSRVFVSLCKNLHWNDVLDKMKSSGIFTEEVLDFFEPFTFAPDMKILNIADKRKILFYHYCYVLKAFYWSGQRDKARQLLKNLQDAYPADWLKNEKDIPQLTRKLMLPDIFLRALKKINKLK